MPTDGARWPWSQKQKPQTKKEHKAMIKEINLARMRDACGFTATYRCGFGNSRKANKERVNLEASNNGTDANATTDQQQQAATDNAKAEKKAKERIKVSKTLIVSKEYDAIRSYMGELRNWVFGQTVPSFFKEGFQLASLKQIERDGIKTSAIEIIEKKMRQATGLVPVADDVPTLPKLIAAFVAAYPAQVEEARATLEPVGQWNARDYPDATELSSMFSIEWFWINFRVADGLPAELQKAEQDKLAAKMADAGEQISQALRIGLDKLLTHATETLKPGPDGKLRIFRDSMLGNIQEFLNTFNQRDLTNDVELAQLVTKANEILLGVTPQKLRDMTLIRENTAAKFEEIKQELGKLITVKPSRAISLDDE